MWRPSLGHAWARRPAQFSLLAVKQMVRQAAMKSIVQRGWVMRGGVPTEIEFEHGFSQVDGFPFCHEVGTWIPIQPFPAPSKEAVIVGYMNLLDRSIAEHRTAIQKLVQEKAALNEQLYEIAKDRLRPAFTKP